MNDNCMNTLMTIMDQMTQFVISVRTGRQDLKFPLKLSAACWLGTRGRASDVATSLLASCH